MTPAQYVTGVRRTLPDIPVEDLLDMIQCGLYGESGEVIDIYKKMKYHDHPANPDKIEEEVGDLLWYLFANFAVAMRTDLGSEYDWQSGLELVSFCQRTDRKSEFDWMATAQLVWSCISDLSSRDFESRVTATHVDYLLSQLDRLASLAGSDLERIAQKNIDKLHKRYPEGFSSEASRNREKT